MTALKAYHKKHNLGVYRCGDTRDGRKILKLPTGYLILPAYVSVSDDKDSVSFVYTRSREPTHRLSCTCSDSTMLFETYAKLLRRVLEEGYVLQRFSHSTRGLKRTASKLLVETPVGVFARQTRSGFEVSYWQPSETGHCAWVYSGSTISLDKLPGLIAAADTKRQLRLAQFEIENQLTVTEALQLAPNLPK